GHLSAAAFYDNVNHEGQRIHHEADFEVMVMRPARAQVEDGVDPEDKVPGRRRVVLLQPSFVPFLGYSCQCIDAGPVGGADGFAQS
ncbi:MAG: hypothetical protein IAG10_24615, partial [Planctomycetaceae bacterium]|nr:hypothetical protein [Planctomycetaceae bacterium]